METTSRKKNILWQYVIWHFFDVPRSILSGWKNFLLFGLNYFSIFLLIKTLFSPWRRYQWSYGRGFDLGRYFEVFFSNLLSRILGAIIRIFLIFIGLVAEVLIVLIGLLVFMGWLILPLLLFIGLIFGFNIVFS